MPGVDRRGRYFAFSFTNSTSMSVGIDWNFDSFASSTRMIALPGRASAVPPGNDVETGVILPRLGSDCKPRDPVRHFQISKTPPPA
jgi:hypothetical protein